MIEVAAVVGRGDRVLHWHDGASSASIPDSRRLWEVLWAARDELEGVAHSHPGSGPPSPSREDLTTFAAVEAGLGRRLRWWITTADELRCFAWAGPGRLDYTTAPSEGGRWLPELRERSTRRKP